MMLASDSVSMIRAWIKVSDRTVHLLTCGIRILVNSRCASIKESGEMNSLLILTGFKPLSLILQGNSQVFEGGKEPALFSLRPCNCKAHKKDAKWTQDKTLWMKWLGFHLGENTFSSLFMGLFVLHPVTVRGKWTNSPENRDQKIQSHPFLFLSLPSKLHSLTCFVFRVVNIIFFPVLTSRLDVEMVFSSPILADHQMFMPEIGMVPHYSGWRPCQYCHGDLLSSSEERLAAILCQEQVWESFSCSPRFLPKQEGGRFLTYPGFLFLLCGFLSPFKKKYCYYDRLSDIFT